MISNRFECATTQTDRKDKRSEIIPRRQLLREREIPKWERLGSRGSSPQSFKWPGGTAKTRGVSQSNSKVLNRKRNDLALSLARSRRYPPWGDGALVVCLVPRSLCENTETAGYSWHAQWNDSGTNSALSAVGEPRNSVIETRIKAVYRGKRIFSKCRLHCNYACNRIKDKSHYVDDRIADSIYLSFAKYINLLYILRETAAAYLVFAWHLNCIYIRV